MGRPAPLQEASGPATVAEPPSLTVTRHLRVTDALILRLGRVLDAATLLHDAKAIRPGREAVVLTSHVAQEVPVVKGAEGLAYAAASPVPPAAEGRRGSQATNRPDPIRRTAVPGPDVVAPTPAVEPARPSILVMAAARAPVTSRAAAVRPAAVEETATTVVQKGTGGPATCTALTFLRPGIVPSADPEMDPTSTRRETRKATTLAKTAAA